MSESQKPSAVPESQGTEPENAGRRDFFNEVTMGALGIAGLGAVVVTYRFLYPDVLFEPSLTFRAGNPDLYPMNSVTYLQEQQVYIVRTEQGFYAVSAVCTHLGCITQWKPEASHIACPCHGSKFRSDGTKIEGPAPRPLPHFSITLTANGELMVKKFETVKPNQVLRV